MGQAILINEDTTGSVTDSIDQNKTLGRLAQSSCLLTTCQCTNWKGLVQHLSTLYTQRGNALEASHNPGVIRYERQAPNSYWPAAHVMSSAYRMQMQL